MILLRHRLACVAIVVILSTATVWATIQAPLGTVTCYESEFSMVITKAWESGKDEKIDVKIGTGKLPDGSAVDPECVYDSGMAVVNDTGATINQTEISGKPNITYGTNTTGVAGMAKCGGTLKDNTNKTMIEYTVAVEVVVRQTIRGVIDRELKYTMDLVCQLTKTVDKQSGGQGWVIDRAALNATDINGDTKTITFPIEINFHADNGGVAGTQLADSSAKVIMGAWVHIKIKETTPNDLFKFITKKCWFTATNDVNAAKPDTFWDDYCPVGKDIEFDDFIEKTKTASEFDIKVKAFFFTHSRQAEVFVHCDLFICLTDDTAQTCTQPTRLGAAPGGCSMTIPKRRRRNALPEPLSKKKNKQNKKDKKRKRTKRSVDDKNNRGWIEHRVVTSKKAILLDRNDVIVPTCGGDFVYDRVARTCSNKNLLEISGLYLDLPWNIEYANTSSKTFKDFASGKAYQLYVLTQMIDRADVILGLEVVSAKKGSVILTVRIKYSATSNAASAFEVFQRAIQNVPARVSNVLNIRSKKVIEYVEVKQRPSPQYYSPPSSGLNVENLTLIIVIVVLCAAVFISVIAVFKVRHARRGASSNAGSEMKAHDNPNFS